MKHIKKVTKILIIAIILLVVLSSAYYNFAEGWSWVDSLYFSVMLVTSVGHGDLVPNSALSKLVTSFVAFFGIAMVLTLFGIISNALVHSQKR